MATAEDVDVAHGLKIWVAGDCECFGLRTGPARSLVSRPSHSESEAKQGTLVAAKMPTHKVDLAARTFVQELKLPSESKIAALAAGRNHAVICCGDQTLLSTGSNPFGQLGNGFDGVNQTGFAALDIRLPIVSVSCGRAHTIMATLYGEVYSCGNNTSGQLGLGDFEDRLVLTRSDLSESNIIDVAAGDNHTLAVTKRGQLFSFGNNCEGQLGISRLQDKQNRTFCNRTDDLTSTAIPTLIQFEPELAACRHPVAFEVLQMSCGSRHSVAIIRTWRMDTREVISDRDLYSWGSNNCGQLGKSRDYQFQGTPRWVQIHPGIPTAQDRPKLPVDFPNPPLKVQRDDVSSMLWYESSGTSDDAPLGGWSTAPVDITSEASLGSDAQSQWKRDGCGEPPVQKGKGKSEGFNKRNSTTRMFEESISVSKKPTRVACGEEFTLVLTADQSVYAFGSGQQGQLGVKGLKDRFEPTLVTVLCGKKVTDVICGQDHAFAIIKGGEETYGWGCNREAQLGFAASPFVELPTNLKGTSLCFASGPEDDAQKDKFDCIRRSCATIVAGSDFSLFGRIEVNGFPKDDPAANLGYNIPSDILVCTLGTAIPRYVPYIEGTPPFAFSVDPPLPEGICLDAQNGQLRGAALMSPGAQLLRYRISASNKCRPDVTTTYVLQLRVVDKREADQKLGASTAKGALGKQSITKRTSNSKLLSIFHCMLSPRPQRKNNPPPQHKNTRRQQPS